MSALLPYQWCSDPGILTPSLNREHSHGSTAQALQACRRRAYEHEANDLSSVVQSPVGKEETLATRTLVASGVLPWGKMLLRN